MIFIMSRICDFCGKGVLVVNNISHKASGGWAKKAPKTKRRLFPNLRKIKYSDIDGNTMHSKICMKCYKSLALK